MLMRGQGVLKMEAILHTSKHLRVYQEPRVKQWLGAKLEVSTICEHSPNR